MTTLRLGLAGLGHGDTLLQANDPEHALPIRVTALCDVNEARLEAASNSTASTRLQLISTSWRRATMWTSSGSIRRVRSTRVR